MRDPQQAPRILLLESDAQLANVTLQRLSHQGFDPSWAADGRTALELLERGDFDVILADLPLPGDEDLLSCLAPAVRRHPLVVLANPHDALACTQAERLAADCAMVEASPHAAIAHLPMLLEGACALHRLDEAAFGADPAAEGDLPPRY